MCKIADCMGRTAAGRRKKQHPLPLQRPPGNIWHKNPRPLICLTLEQYDYHGFLPVSHVLI